MGGKHKKDKLHIYLILLLLIFSIFLLKDYLVPILTGAVFAYMTLPIYKKFNKKISRESVSALLVLLLFILLVTIPSAFILNALSSDASNLYNFGKDLINSGDILGGCNQGVCGWVTKDLGLGRYIKVMISTLADSLVKFSGELIFSMPSRILGLFLMLFSFYYTLKDSKLIKATLDRYFIIRKRHQREIYAKIKEVTFSLLYGFILVAIIQGVLGSIGFWIFGVSSPIFWGLIVALFAFVPFLGPAVIWVPAAGYLIWTGYIDGASAVLWRGVGLSIYSLLFLSGIDAFLKPKIIGEKSNVHPFIILLGVVGGVATMGIGGIIIGPLVLVLAITSIELYIRYDLKR